MLENPLNLGYISRSQGLKGEVRCTTHYPDIIKQFNHKTVCLEKEGRQSFFLIEDLRTRDKDSICLKLKGVDDKNQADHLKGHTVWVEKNSIPKLPDSSYYPFELPGVSIHDKKLGNLGVIQEVYTLPAQLVAEFIYAGKAVMFPVIPIFVEKLDRENNILFTDLPDGLLEVYLEDKPDKGK